MRDIRVRYKQTALGVIWVVVQPLLASLFRLRLRRLARFPRTGSLHPLRLRRHDRAGAFLRRPSAEASISRRAIPADQRRSTFPRLILPLAAASAALVDLAGISLVLMVVDGWLWYRLAGYRLRRSPLVLDAGWRSSRPWPSASGWPRSLNVRYRDVDHMRFPFVLQIWTVRQPRGLSRSNGPRQLAAALLAQPPGRSASAASDGRCWARPGCVRQVVPSDRGVIADVCVGASSSSSDRSESFADVHLISVAISVRGPFEAIHDRPSNAATTASRSSSARRPRGRVGVPPGRPGTDASGRS